MSRKQSSSDNTPRASKGRKASGSKVRSAIVIALAIFIVATFVLAQVNTKRKSAKASNDVLVMNPSAGSPAKEYIYAGSKLVATEEPISFADPGITTNPYYSDILKIARRRVTVGCGANEQGQPLFCPDDPVTREQMAAFIVRALGEFSPPTPPTQRFTDVTPLNVFYNFIDRLAALGITVGCDLNGPRYCPGDYVLHEQMSAFIDRAIGVPSPPPPQSQTFCDVPPSNPFYAHIEYYANSRSPIIWPGCGGIGNCPTGGCNTNCTTGRCFCPCRNVIRAEMAHILVQAFGANWQ